MEDQQPSALDRLDPGRPGWPSSVMAHVWDTVTVVPWARTPPAPYTDLDAARPLSDVPYRPGPGPEDERPAPPHIP